MCTFIEIFTTLYAIISTFIPLPEADVCVTFFKLLLCAIYLRLQILSLDIFEEGTLLIIDEIQVYNYQNMTLFKVFLNTMFALLTVPFSNQLIPAMKKYVLKQHYIRASKFTAPYINLNASPNSTQSTEPTNATDMEHTSSAKDTESSITILEQNSINCAPTTATKKASTKDTKSSINHLKQNDNSNASITNSNDCSKETKSPYFHLEQHDNDNAPVTAEPNDFTKVTQPTHAEPLKLVEPSRLSDRRSTAKHEAQEKSNPKGDNSIQLKTENLQFPLMTPTNSIILDKIRAITRNPPISKKAEFVRYTNLLIKFNNYIKNNYRMSSLSETAARQLAHDMCKKCMLMNSFVKIYSKEVLPYNAQCNSNWRPQSTIAMDVAIKFIMHYAKSKNTNEACKRTIEEPIPNTKHVLELLREMTDFQRSCERFIMRIKNNMGKITEDPKFIPSIYAGFYKYSFMFEWIINVIKTRIYKDYKWACIVKMLNTEDVELEADFVLNCAVFNETDCSEVRKVLALRKTPSSA